MGWCHLQFALRRSAWGFLGKNQLKSECLHRYNGKYRTINLGGWSFQMLLFATFLWDDRSARLPCPMASRPLIPCCDHCGRVGSLRELCSCLVCSCSSPGIWLISSSFSLLIAWTNGLQKNDRTTFLHISAHLRPLGFQLLPSPCICLVVSFAVALPEAFASTAARAWPPSWRPLASSFPWWTPSMPTTTPERRPLVCGCRLSGCWLEKDRSWSVEPPLSHQVMIILIREFSTPDEEMKKIVLKALK